MPPCANVRQANQPVRVHCHALRSLSGPRHGHLDRWEPVFTCRASSIALRSSKAPSGNGLGITTPSFRAFRIHRLQGSTTNISSPQPCIGVSPHSAVEMSILRPWSNEVRIDVPGSMRCTRQPVLPSSTSQVCALPDGVVEAHSISGNSLWVHRPAQNFTNHGVHPPNFCAYGGLRSVARFVPGAAPDIPRATAAFALGIPGWHVSVPALRMVAFNPVPSVLCLCSLHRSLPLPVCPGFRRGPDRQSAASV